MTTSYDFTNGQGFVDAFDSLKIWERTFVLSPERWRTAISGLKLDWDWVLFDENSKTNIPTERGLYAFVVEYCDAYFPPHGYIMYVES